MIVKELIEKLQAMPPHALVMCIDRFVEDVEIDRGLAAIGEGPTLVVLHVTDEFDIDEDLEEDEQETDEFNTLTA